MAAHPTYDFTFPGDTKIPDSLWDTAFHNALFPMTLDFLDAILGSILIRSIGLTSMVVNIVNPKGFLEVSARANLFFGTIISDFSGNTKILGPYLLE
jgi:hypothetical protein